MTAPRQYLPGTAYFVTRRCFQRHFYLRPSKRTTGTFGFVLAVTAARYEIEVHAACVLSNHCYGVTCQHA